MNCDAAHEELIDRLYGELPDEHDRDLRQHLDACQACRAEWESLRFARGAVAGAYAAQPPLRQFDPAAAARRARIRPYLRAAGGLAAAAALLFGLLLLQGPGMRPAVAQAGPPEIQRVGVSLTILSQPEGWAAPNMQADQQMAQMQMPVQRLVQARQINAPFRRWGVPAWRGLALVRDRRLVQRLPKGTSRVSFTDVPSGILPDTVRLRGTDHPDALTILEQNYQYDLASAAAVLKRHVDKPVTAVFKDGAEVRGTLLSCDAAALVVRLPGGQVRNLARALLRGIAFDKLPQGLLSRPTLLWELHNAAAAPRQRFEVAYLTEGLTWRADYVLKLHPARKPPAKPQAADAGQARAPDIVDTCDLVGYATVNNFSGVTYEQAELKLMAGDVKVIRPEPQPPMLLGRASGQQGEKLGEQMQEKSFFEYHLYTLTRPTTIRSSQTKQIEMVSGGGIGLRRGYVYDPASNATAARVVSELTNSKENGLGKPLPKGVVRLYAPDGEGAEAYVSQTTIDHTPKDEKLRLPWGYAFDIACATKQTQQRTWTTGGRRTLVCQIRNHKDHDVNVTVIVRLPRATYELSCPGFRWHVREVGVVEVDVPARANATTDVTVTYSWDHTRGGGLTSPHDAAKSTTNEQEGEPK